MLAQFDLLRYWFAGLEGLEGMKVGNIPVRHGVIMWASGRLPRKFVLRYWASVLGDGRVPSSTQVLAQLDLLG